MRLAFYSACVAVLFCVQSTCAQEPKSWDFVAIDAPLALPAPPLNTYAAADYDAPKTWDFFSLADSNDIEPTPAGEPAATCPCGEDCRCVDCRCIDYATGLRMADLARRICDPSDSDKRLSLIVSYKASPDLANTWAARAKQQGNLYTVADNLRTWNGKRPGVYVLSWANERPETKPILQPLEYAIPAGETLVSMRICGPEKCIVVDVPKVR